MVKLYCFAYRFFYQYTHKLSYSADIKVFQIIIAIYAV